MKIFSISFNLRKEDYKNFYNAVNKSMNVQRFKLMAIILTVVFALIVMQLYNLAVTAFFLLFVMFFLADIVNRVYIMRMNDKSTLGKRKTTVY